MFSSYCQVKCEIVLKTFAIHLIDYPISSRNGAVRYSGTRWIIKEFDVGNAFRYFNTFVRGDSIRFAILTRVPNAQLKNALSSFVPYEKKKICGWVGSPARGHISSLGRPQFSLYQNLRAPKSPLGSVLTDSSLVSKKNSAPEEKQISFH